MRIDFSGMPAGFEAAFVAERTRRLERTIVEANRAQDALNRDAVRDQRSVEGLGAPKFTLDATVYAEWRRREGPGFHRDRTWRRWAKANGLAEIRARGTRCQVGGCQVPGATRADGFVRTGVNRLVKHYG